MTVSSSVLPRFLPPLSSFSRRNRPSFFFYCVLFLLVACSIFFATRGLSFDAKYLAPVKKKNEIQFGSFLFSLRITKYLSLDSQVSRTVDVSFGGSDSRKRVAFRIGHPMVHVTTFSDIFLFREGTCFNDASPSNHFVFPRNKLVAINNDDVNNGI